MLSYYLEASTILRSRESGAVVAWGKDPEDEDVCTMAVAFLGALVCHTSEARTEEQ